MSIAKKCDVCGKYYESYNTKNKADEPNGIMFVNIDEQQKYYAHKPIDTCPSCIESIRSHLDTIKVKKGE